MRDTSLRLCGGLVLAVALAACKDAAPPPPPAALFATVQPSLTSAAGAQFAQQPEIQLRDANDADAKFAGVMVTAAIVSGGGTLSGTSTVATNADGRAVFSNLAISGTVGSRVLQFSSGELTSVTSSGINVTAGAASVLAITTQPSTNAFVGASFERQPVVQLRDAFGNAAAQTGVVITAALASGEGTLMGTTSASTNASGAATFTDLKVEGSAGARTLSFSATGFTAVTSGPVNLTNDPCVVDPVTDSDGDRLPNCVESGTNVWVSAQNTGTNPSVADTDGDGLKDGDEVLGTEAGLALHQMGVHPLRKNLLIEFDWFNDSNECGSHSHRPTATTIQMVTDAYANAPVTNPDGTMGITVISDYGQGGVFDGGNLIADADGLLGQGVNGADFMNHKVANFAETRHGFFYYALLPHRYAISSGSSGQAELPGDDMIVSLYCANSDVNVANTIMHEWGHNLGLGHGGHEHVNWKPNYNSVMNYRYQFPGVDNDCTPPGNGVLDYSRGTRPALDEMNLDERNGICGSGSPAVDWNANGSPSDFGFSRDINVDNGGTGDGVMVVLQDNNDWATIHFAGLQVGTDGMSIVRAVVTCNHAPPMPKVPR